MAWSTLLTDVEDSLCRGQGWDVGARFLTLPSGSNIPKKLSPWYRRYHHWCRQQPFLDPVITTIWQTIPSVVIFVLKQDKKPLANNSAGSKTVYYSEFELLVYSETDLLPWCLFFAYIWISFIEIVHSPIQLIVLLRLIFTKIYLCAVKLHLISLFDW